MQLGGNVWDVASASSLDGVDVWTASLDDLDARRRERYRGWLTPDERLAEERFATEQLRDEWLLARALCRWVLSRHAPEVAPGAWRFERTEAGRPFVAGPASALANELPSFNVSHGGGLVVCAVSKYVVGVDVEPLARGRDVLATAEKMFSEHELAALGMLDEAERPLRALALWTVKEAYLKARGHGIALRLGRFTVAPDRVEPTRWELVDVSALGDDPRTWQLHVTPAGEQHTIAVAVKRGLERDLGLRVLPVVPE